MDRMKTLALALSIAAGLAMAGCDRTPSAGNNNDDHEHAEGDGHDHEEAGTGHDHGTGEVIALGEQTAGAFSIRASRDAGAIAAGGEALVDVWVTGGEVAAVRFWVGTQDAAGSIKARAEIEDPADPTRYHTHAAVPDPMPEGAMLWVEVEDAAGGVHTASFPLQP